jgi:tetratricopeptide (TPR) repeat protein
MCSRRPLIIVSFLCSLLSGVAVAAPATKEASRSVERPSRGKVIGYILDAETRQPIEGVRVMVEQDGTFATSEKPILTSDKGRFDARAALGKVSSRLDFMRLVTSHWISLVLQPRSVLRQTKVIDVSQINIRAEKAGYRPFVGPVRCARIDADRYAVTLDDIWLAPERSGLASFAPDNVETELFDALTVEPAAARPGQKVTLTLRARLPIDRGQQYEIYAYSSARDLLPAGAMSRVGKPDLTTRTVTFQRIVTVPRKPKQKWTEVSAYFVRVGEYLPLSTDVKALLQVVDTDPEATAAQLVAAGYALAEKDDGSAAVHKLDEAIAASPTYMLAHLMRGDTCLALNRPEAAAESYQKVLELTPEAWQTVGPRRALALLEQGNTSSAVQELNDLEKQFKAKKIREIPPQIYLYRARCAASEGNFTEADVNLARAGRLGMQIPTTVQREINVKRAQAAVQKDPSQPDARLALARVLTDAERPEEAAVEIRHALSLDSQQPWARLELGQLYEKLGRLDEALAEFEAAHRMDANNLEVRLALAGAYRTRRRYADALPHYRAVVERRPTNFFARLNLALVLYQTGEEAVAKQEFQEALKRARGKGTMRNEGFGYPGSAFYLGPKKRMLAGFSLPEGRQVYTLLDSLDTLRTHPENALARLNLGRALVALKLPDMATVPLEKALAQMPELTEARYALALARRDLGETEEARTLLEAVLKENPMHPHANLDLARLYGGQGDLETAQAHVLAHRRYWPEDRDALAGEEG